MIIDSDFVYLPACGNRGFMCGYCDDVGHMQLVAQRGLHMIVMPSRTQVLQDTQSS